MSRLLFAVHPCDMAVVTSSVVEEASALIASAAAGDEMAFASIVRLHHEDMRRVCVVVAGDDGIAEDAVTAAERQLGMSTPGGPEGWSSGP
jgi:23S rRNA pseudoU1915 N3-methylase RlmH